MQTNRRNWLRQMGLAFAGIGLAPVKALALTPAVTHANHHPGDQPIRLSSNENPYGPSPMARIAMAEEVLTSNRYNWQLSSELVSAIAVKNSVSDDNILLGAGSTEILDLVVRFSAIKQGSFMLADPTYGYWANMAQAMGLKKIAVPVTADKRHDLPAMLKAIVPDTQLIYVCNPNNPTGTLCEREALIAFIQEATKQTIVLVDEAYLDFTTQQSLARLVIENKNLIIAKTFSKIYGMAGARTGYAIAHASTIEQLSKLQVWANGSISVASASGALASLKDHDFVKTTYTSNERAKKYTIEQLERLKISCIPSHSNFIYFSLSDYKPDFFERLKANNIIGTKIYEENGKWSRITVGTMGEMEKFIIALQ